MRKIILLALMLVVALQGIGQISFSEEVLYKGTTVNIILIEPVDTVIIEYRPNSQVVKKEYLVGDAAKTFEWTPSQAGVVAIQAGNQSETASVRFPGASFSGIAIMILAAILLFGGATFAFRLLMKGKPVEEIDVDIEHRVDT